MEKFATCALWVAAFVAYVYGTIRAAAFLMRRMNRGDGDPDAYQRLVVKRQLLWSHVCGEVEARSSWTTDVNEMLPQQGESAARLFEKKYVVTRMLECTKDEHAFLKKEREHCLRELSEADDRCSEAEIDASIFVLGLGLPDERIRKNP